ncbi:MAG: arginase family protein [Candidatus Aenigmarchaeota archaeon]|nr:arginase family protein [Candidatus Aenigmarchaeota archaeon]
MFLYTEEINLLKEQANSKKKINTKYTLFGVPFDSTETTLPGQRKGPNSIRAALLSIEADDLFERITDIGNLIVVEGNASKTLFREEETIDDLLKHSNSTIPFILGGEHTITIGAIKSLLKKYPDFDILCFDAHYDLKDEWQTEKINHSTLMRRVFELNKNLAFIGAREYSKEEELFLKKNNIDKNLERIKESDKPLYISIDADVFDPSIIPGVSDSVPQGLSIKQFFDELKIFERRKIIGIDFVEFNPLIEEYTTSRNIAYIIKKVMDIF